ncbi:UPF0489 family protein [Vibrio hepatarius]|uniref:UPF0489 family protein n=1 Tax=Vibrio hepatarius TaxID=171383 RepID=UPI00148B595B|nr:UPF0489 family protein [Vibrio hepatarius]
MEEVSIETPYGKRVFIFENHATAFQVWANETDKHQHKPFVISLDFHSDTKEAYSRNFPIKAERIDYQKKVLNEFYVCDMKIAEAMKELQHDEHIDASIKAGIISHSFSLQFQDFRGTLSEEENQYYEIDATRRHLERIPYPSGPFHYELPENKMFVIAPNETITDADILNSKNSVLEDSFLEVQFRKIESIMGSGWMENTNYILDIDLDYFTTYQSVRPEKPNAFYELIRNCSFITIAKESGCVLANRLAGEHINSSILLDNILGQITTACSMYRTGI